MKKLYPILILFLTLNCYAQDTTIVLRQRMFDKASDYISLGQLDGWLFKTGSDTTWARKDINTTSWEKLRPVDLTAKYADKNGRVECWFRIKVKPGAGFKDDRPGISYNSWPAADVYLNGKLLSSWGNTGLNRRPYAGYTTANADSPVLIDLKPGAEYVIVIHLVDHLSPLPPARLTINDSAPEYFLVLTGPHYNDTVWKGFFEGTTTHATWLCACAILCLLFWLIAIQNRDEKELRSIAICSTFFFVWACFQWLFDGLGLSYTDFLIVEKSLAIAFQLIFVSVPFVIAGIFKRKISRSFSVVMIIAGTSVFAVDLFLPPSVARLFILCDLFLVGVCVYYVITTWKKLHGAQWSIVAGLMASLIFIIIVIIVFIASAPNGVPAVWLAVFFTGFVLSFPLSMLVYVAVRLKLTIKEVRESARQVLALSEEKKQEALNRQKILEEEVNRQTAEIRANQARLIQSEKMASLGELTAGIAHEIQNPLNFVNNFSEVNREMIDELKEELKDGNVDEALAIADDIKQNEDKIGHHGKRADSIVKGMLEHSRSHSGQKEPTDLNGMADEFMRLSYHGLRAKDKSFNAEMVTCFDLNLPKVSVVQQDMGRVLLNLFNNAFYAVNQKAKTAGAAYKPEVTVSTAFENGGVIIKVKDNGVGIPDAIKEKIMQPFFTTKPTGEGTGLGLSLTYDMVVKGHGGSIKVESKEGEGSEFVITLPVV